MKKGSALLVVLGMLAFMLFSGLAFSVYMRQSRLPTSFLRRTSATRQLAKAALAEAIEEIDQAIGNDPHPGVNVHGNSNYWYGRVFFGKETSSPSWNSETVPTLTLEGLAYLPPNLINDVRFYSRSTPTAKWQSFWFDSGRYAYTAIDVSDYFDVNRVLANKPRAACASRRISLAYAFEKSSGNNLHNDPGTGADKWDDFMKEYRLVDDDGKPKSNAEPLVSLADLNIEWISNGPSDLPSPFSNYLKGENVYGSASGTDEKSEKYRCMTFVTDSWFPTSDDDVTPVTKRKKVDLCSEQPFTDSELNGSSMPNLIKTMSFGSSEVDDYLSKHLCRLGRAQLWDYLDVNRVPVSLAVPTCERVPMIAGIELSSLPTFKFTTTKSESYENETETSRTIIRKYECKAELGGTVGVRALAAYPFLKRGVDDSDDDFTVDGRVAIFLTVDGQTMTLRPGASNASLHLTKSDIDGGQNAAPTADSVFSVALAKQQIKGSDIAKNESEPAQEIPMVGRAEGEVQFFTVTYKWNQTKPKEGSTWSPANPPEGQAPEKEGTSASFRALAKDGATSSEFGDAFASKIASGISVRANAAVWLRVKYNDPDMGEKTVDLVPACLGDDVELNGASASSSMQGYLGSNYPLLRFDAKMQGQDTLTVKPELNGEYPLTVTKSKIAVSDPRYNHAPENWEEFGQEMTAQNWVSAAKTKASGRDGDIYMFTSDAGYMQSVYELAFLPSMTDLSSKDGDDAWGPTGNYSTDYSERTDFSGTAKDDAIMWRTYNCFDTTVAERFRQIGLVCGEDGVKVNPYSDSTRVLMAALANTPHDWRVASTNKAYAVVSDSEMKDAATFNKKHAWNAYSPKENGALCWDCLEEFAEKFSSAARSSGNWETAFAGLGWSNDKRKLLNELDSDDSDLYSVDKKFLYGFWHDSFSVRQQLFLIFVRAEPMMMGGGVSGQAPPQLGARAVALVWRDPMKTKELSSGDTSTAYPHRTRILFYHQFD